MSKKGKLIFEAMNRIDRDSVGAHFSYKTIQDELSRIYDAGGLEAPDEDAAKWRMLVQLFGNKRASFVQRVAYHEPMPIGSYTNVMTPETTMRVGARWRFECVWNEPTGNADTLPKFIELALSEIAK